MFTMRTDVQRVSVWTRASTSAAPRTKCASAAFAVRTIHPYTNMTVTKFVTYHTCIIHNILTEQIIAFAVFQCEHKYCDEKCDFGNVLDDYGCETCECIDPCQDVKCSDKEVCVNGVCGKLTASCTCTFKQCGRYFSYMYIYMRNIILTCVLKLKLWHSFFILLK